MEQILLIGDSHTGAIDRCEGIHIIKFYRDHPITARDLSDEDAWCWEQLDFFLKEHSNNGNKRVVLAVNEVDIRVHYWKHMIESVAKGNTIEKYIKDLADKLYQSIKNIADKYDLSRIVLWGPPPIPHNQFKCEFDHWPFTGDLSTRNIMTHMFNCAFVEAIESDDTETRIGFATAYYHFMYSKDYIAEGGFSPDGTHYDGSFHNMFWGIIRSVIDNQKDVNLHLMFNYLKNDKFTIDSRPASLSFRYHSWVLASDTKEPDAEHRSVVINDKKYHFLKVPDKEKWPEIDPYHELCLVPVL